MDIRFNVLAIIIGYGTKLMLLSCLEARKSCDHREQTASVTGALTDYRGRSEGLREASMLKKAMSIQRPEDSLRIM